MNEEVWAQAANLPEPLKHKVEQTLSESEHQAEQDRKGIARIAAACGPTPVVVVPRFELDVHDPKALWDTSQPLFGEALKSGGQAG